MNQADSIAVSIENLSRHFRGKAALTNVDLQIPRGCVFGLVGLNGAGKTTLIRHLIGSYQAQSGRVTVLGLDPVAEPQALLQRVGYLTEEDSLPKWIRVGEMIEFLRALYPTWDDSYASELCDLFSLSRKDSLKSLSKGGRARVGLLAAIAHRPELLILDEPSSGLDPIARRDILEAVIRTVNEDGRTVLFSSHLLDEVDRVCDHIALLHEGQIQQQVNAGDLSSEYVELIVDAKSSEMPPQLKHSLDWRRMGDEWSGVCLATIVDAESNDPALAIIERRPLSLPRWFEAHTQAQENAS